ncbi:hypothetical protein [Erwinia mallotivora]|uniref:Type III secretion system protein n=1 Tax=Erwinia mallotivora TaxID=69222 RepID=A0A014M3X6_9GAMM|nr:hypothetical protein [Erwinia mallotivora]EXU76561.1 type III secretion system protein [Erwinia mallotivora]
MDVWRKGRTFVSMLERKQKILQGNILQVQGKIAEINKMISQFYDEYAGINQEIKRLTPSGVLDRDDIYKGIRRQGTLLVHQQNVIQKITKLEDEKIKYEHQLQNFLTALSLLDKRHHKISDYLQKIRKAHLKRIANSIENEIQEMAGYVRKN